MPTQLSAWTSAWRRLDEKVLTGPLSKDRAPLQKVRRTLFNTVFAELPTELRSTRHQARQLAETQVAAIEAAAVAHAEDLVTLTRVAEFVKGWFADTQAAAPQLTNVRNSADVWCPLVQAMAADAGDIAALGAQSATDWEAWLRVHHQLDIAPEDRVADPAAIREHLHAPGVAKRVDADLAEAWERRPVAERPAPVRLDPMGFAPWRPPDAHLLADVVSRADAALAAWPADALAYRLCLTRQEGPLQPPTTLPTRPEAGQAVTSSDDDGPIDEADEDSVEDRLPAPLDRNLLLRLVHRNKPRLGSRTRGITVPHLVGEEVARAAAPLGLLDVESRRAMVAAGATLATSLWVDDLAEIPEVARRSPDAYLWQGAAHIRRQVFGKHAQFDLLSRETQWRINEPIASFGPRLWSRLHNRERDGRPVDAWGATWSVWTGWLKSLYQPNPSGPPPLVLDDRTDPGTPAVDIPSWRQRQAMLQLLALVPGPACAFGYAARAGTATSQEWDALTAAADEADPEAISSWPSFADMDDYLRDDLKDRT